jgi:hypothetical protein
VSAAPEAGRHGAQAAAPAWPRGPFPAPTGDPPAYGVPIGAELCGGVAGIFFGGWGLGLLTEAAQLATGRRLLDLAVSYLRPVRRGARLAVRCEVAAAGRTLHHLRLAATDKGRPALTGSAVVGPAVGPVAGPGRAPRVPPPLDCPERTYEAGPGSGTSALLEVRTAGSRGDVLDGGSIQLWARLRCDVPPEVRLAVVSDHVPYLMRRALPVAHAATVSASLRLLGGPVADWVLLDVRLLAHGDRTAVGRVDLWSGGERLAGVGEQTAWLTPR